ncbi:hypothetical protein CI109_102071 [Kwoniella shandongensis]|uniref:Uncharacterized protein n=1 Tax=Kwoniella shandongensis TaxID=1734106 RepID=A0A5M6BSZ3_9TREE|nr:uncharacterized protein CI109_006520 [Kwoniella shandongensis]KAA5525150.1 hypothetical protein CI109_006520 [Kwoniella shandongensis]
MSTTTNDIPIPRYDFYQTPEQLIVAVYVKGYGGPEIKDRVKVDFQPQAAIIDLPPLNDESETKRISLEPLWSHIVPERSTIRVLSTKIELKLAKVSSANWPTLLSDPSQPSTSAPLAPPPTTAAHPEASSSTSKPSTEIDALPQSSTTKDTIKTGNSSKKKNWDKVVDDELEEGDQTKDPNGGGDAALQKFFSQIYSGADDDTKRAMIKSFTESGGTTLSTDWNNIGKETTPIRPPDGMEVRKV